MGVGRGETGWAGPEASGKAVGGQGDRVDKPVCPEDGQRRSPDVTVSEKGISGHKGFSSRAEERKQWVLGKAGAEPLVAMLLVAVPVSPALLRCISWTEVTCD